MAGDVAGALGRATASESLLMGGLAILFVGYVAGWADGINERHRRRWPRGHRR